MIKNNFVNKTFVHTFLEKTFDVEPKILRLITAPRDTLFRMTWCGFLNQQARAVGSFQNDNGGLLESPGPMNKVSTQADTRLYIYTGHAHAHAQTYIYVCMYVYIRTFQRVTWIKASSFGVLFTFASLDSGHRGVLCRT